MHPPADTRTCAGGKLWHRVAVAAAAATVLFAYVGSARVAAQAPAQTDLGAARAAFREGIAATEARDWAAAEAAFARSYGFAPRAITLLNLAGAQAEAGRLVEAIASYRRFLAMNLSERAQARRPVAERALRTLAARVGRVELTIHRGWDIDTIDLDGKTLTLRQWTEPLTVNPGHHELSVATTDGRQHRIPFPLAEGEHRSVEVSLEAAQEPAPEPELDVLPAVEATPPPAASAPMDEAPSEPIWSSPWFWTIAGGSALALVLTIVLVAVTSGPSASTGTLEPGRLILE